eukprot:2685982-Lingulodinium_polyedra.AAC.1
MPQGRDWTKSDPADSWPCRGRASSRDAGNCAPGTKRADPWPPTFLCPTRGGDGQNSRSRCCGI